MEQKKHFFADIKSMLSRDQMKQIKGGSQGNPVCGTTCSGYDYQTQFTFIGTCGSVDPGVCGCYNSAFGFAVTSQDCIYNYGNL